jgi:hypothetical protein
VRYRQARLAIERARHGSLLGIGTIAASGQAHNVALGHEAVQYAAECVRIFEALEDPVGHARARCLLMRALVVARQFGTAARLRADLRMWLDANRHSDAAPGNLVHIPIEARFLRACGEMQLEMGTREQAWKDLTESTRLFRLVRDWNNARDIAALLDTIPTVPPTS